MIIREYRKHLQENKSENTVRNYISTLKDFKEYVRIPLESVTYEDFQNYIWRLRENGLKNRTVNLKISRIKNFYRFLEGKKNVSQQIDKIINSKYLKVEHNNRHIFTERMIMRLLESDLKLRIKVIVILVFTGALNVRELEGLKKESFIVKENYVKLKVYNHFTEKRRVIYIPKKFYPYIEEYMNKYDSEYLFYSQRTGKYLTRETLNKELQYSGYELIGERISQNDLKVSCYNYLFDKGLSLFTIAEIMNFSDVDILISHLVNKEYRVTQEIGEIFS